MPTFSSVSIPKPKDWQAFERDARLLFEFSLNDPHIQNNGRVGQPQHGVDIFGRRGGLGGYVGIQCKGKDADYGGSVTEAELRAEVQKSAGFQPPISEFILITTAPDDAAIQRVARELDEEVRRSGRAVKISVWGWGRIQQEIVRFPEAIKAFHPDASPFTDVIIEQNDQIKELVKQHSIELRRVDERVLAIESRLMQMQLGTVGSAASEAALDRHIHEEIDSYRDMINRGRPSTAIELLTALQGRLVASSSARVRFRIVANIAVAHHRRGELDAAARLFAEAYELSPNDPGAISNKIAALLIENRTQEAHSLAVDALARLSDNPDIALQRLQALDATEDFDTVWSSLSTSVIEKSPLRLRRILFLRERRDPQWRSLLETAILADPNNPVLRGLEAHSILQRVTDVDETALGALAGDSPNRAELARAAAEFESLWANSLGKELEPDWASAHNGGLAASIGDLGTCARLLDDALARGTPVEESKKLRLSVFVRNGQHAEAIALADTLDLTPRNAIFRADLRVKSQPAAARELLASRATFTDRRDVVAAAQIYIDSLLNEGKYEDAVSEANRLEAVLPDDPLSALSLYLVYSTQGDASAASYLYEAIKRLKSETDYFERFLVAQTLESAGKFDEVVHLLDNRVTLVRDSPALRLLISAAANADRRSTLHKILSALPTEVLEIPFYLRVRAALAIRLGNVADAEEYVRAYLWIRPRSLEVQLQLLHILARQEKGGDLRVEVARPASNFDGTAEDFVVLAQLKEAHGDWREAHELAYRMWINNQNSAAVSIRYVGVFLRPGHSTDLDPAPTIVSENMAVSLRERNGSSDVFVIEPDATLRPTPKHISTQHRVAEQLLGKRLGDEVTLADGSKVKIEWIKPKQLHALHQIMENFQRLFPETEGLERVDFSPTQADGLQPIFERVRSRHDVIQQAFAQYAKGQIPIAILARSVGSDPVDTLRGLIEAKQKIIVCDGTQPERNAAFSAIKANSRGCVVDALTLQVIWGLNLKSAVESVCGTIGITEHTVARVQEKIHEIEQRLGEPDMSLFVRDGQLFREEISPEQKRYHITKLREQRDWIAALEMVPSRGLYDPSSEFRNLARTFGQSLSDDLLAAQGSNRLFVSEDRAMRLLAITEFGVGASWLQPILMKAEQGGFMSRGDYNSAILGFIKMGLEFMSVDAQLLVWTLHATREAVLPNDFVICAQRLGGPSADLESHVDVVMKTIKDTFDDYNLSATLRLLIVGTLLENLCRQRTLEETGGVLRAFAQLNFRLRSYIAVWAKGHFLPAGIV
jgi:tetratricopeptide (TPR) repeat protein